MNTYAKIALNIGTHGLFTYRIPPALEGKVLPGCYVGVPFGPRNRMAAGFCVEVDRGPGDIPPERIKAVAKLLYPEPLFSPEMLSLCRWISRYYLCPLGEVMAGMIPPGIRRRTASRAEPRYVLVHRGAGALKRAPAQRKVLEYLENVPGREASRRDILRAAGCTPGVLRVLEEKGLVRRVFSVSLPEAPSVLEGREVEELTPEQEKAYRTIRKHLDQETFAVLLLKGITGSGKTELYIRAIGDVLSRGKTAVLLVPEIVLTPQMHARFSARFERVAVMHSRLSAGERAALWKEIKRGRFDLVIGPRSALFSPLPRLGLIILDEEHEHTYKQETAPRYHARDVAVVMASRLRIPVILGSATPSMESLRNAEAGKYVLLTLSTRAGGGSLPLVHVVDMTEERRGKHRPGGISLPLARRIEETLRRGEQAIVFINQRGFSRFACCPFCGKSIRCPRCDITLTYHKEEFFLCHYCGLRKPLLRRCPVCGHAPLAFKGAGTQKIEEELRARFPAAVVQRMDSDAMTTKRAYRRVLTAFAEKRIHILVGTQIVAKGLDFPNVTTVGIVEIENMLHLPDFRAPERTFNMICQVAGRAGRGSKGGHVFLDVYDTEHYAIQCAAAHDIDRFYRVESSLRKELHYPPFGSLVRVLLEGKSRERVNAYGRELAARLKKTRFARRVIVLGPAEPPLGFINGRHRRHILLKVPDKMPYGGLFPDHRVFESPAGVKVTVDVDPLSML